MENLRDCLDALHSTWLATSISSCFQKPQDGRDKPEPSVSGISTSSSTDQH